MLALWGDRDRLVPLAHRDGVMTAFPQAQRTGRVQFSTLDDSYYVTLPANRRVWRGLLNEK